MIARMYDFENKKPLNALHIRSIFCHSEAQYMHRRDKMISIKSMHTDDDSDKILQLFIIEHNIFSISRSYIRACRNGKNLLHKFCWIWKLNFVSDPDKPNFNESFINYMKGFSKIIELVPKCKFNVADRRKVSWLSGSLLNGK